MKTVVQTARKVTKFMVIEVLSSSRGSHIAILLFPRSGQSKHALFLSYALLWPLPSPLRLIKLACRACWEERDPGIWQRAVLSPLTSECPSPLEPLSINGTGWCYPASAGENGNVSLREICFKANSLAHLFTVVTAMNGLWNQKHTRKSAVPLPQTSVLKLFLTG